MTYQNDGVFPFKDWIEMVKKEYLRVWGFLPEPFNDEDWLDYYNNDYTAADAVMEDLSYAE